jgi:alanine racemase
VTPSRHVDVRIDLQRLRANAADIRARVGVSVIAVVKADAYGHGAAEVVEALADVVDGYYVFSLAEALAADVRATGKPTLALNPDRVLDAEAFLANQVRPAVWDVDAARALRPARPAVCVDVGMQRFAAEPGEVLADVIDAGGITEAFAHCSTIGEARDFRNAITDVVGDARQRQLTKFHAAGSKLLDEPDARLDAVRPGLALYRGAARVTARLVEVRDSRGPIGYSGWTSTTGRHGVIVAGYSNGLRTGPCVVNGEARRVAEVGMQSAFVEVGPNDKPGDEVVLLGDDPSAADVAKAWGTSPQELLVRLCGMGRRRYHGA